MHHEPAGIRARASPARVPLHCDVRGLGRSGDRYRVHPRPSHRHGDRLAHRRPGAHRAARAGLPHSDGDRRLGPVRSRLPVADRLHCAAPLPPHPRGTRFAAAPARGGGRRLRDVPEGGGQRRGHGRRGLRRLGVLPGQPGAHPSVRAGRDGAGRPAVPAGRARAVRVLHPSAQGRAGAAAAHAGRARAPARRAHPRRRRTRRRAGVPALRGRGSPGPGSGGGGRARGGARGERPQPGPGFGVDSHLGVRHGHHRGRVGGPGPSPPAADWSASARSWPSRSS